MPKKENKVVPNHRDTSDIMLIVPMSDIAKHIKELEDSLKEKSAVSARHNVPIQSKINLLVDILTKYNSDNITLAELTDLRSRRTDEHLRKAGIEIRKAQAEENLRKKSYAENK